MSLSLLATTPIISSKNPLHKTPNKRVPTTSLRVNNTITCEQKQNVVGPSPPSMDRRNVLLGLGGLYGATATISNQANAASGGPIQPPDLSKCHLATDSDAGEQVNCCPPYSTAEVHEFKLPEGRLRHRKPAHLLTPDEIEKYNAAVAKMKQLDPKDPWHFMQQATIHCTYCNGAFDQYQHDGKLLQVHGSWLFLPWHRMYLYFWERILGTLIDDPTFAIPYWNWDNPEAMTMPGFYTDKSAYPWIYNDNRNHDHYKALMDLGYNLGDPNPRPDQYPEVKLNNLRKVYNIYKETLGKPRLFMGAPITAGEEAKEGAGALENMHNLPHQWVGPVDKPYHDMGNFYTAARDTIFFGHHANIDRMWEIYSIMRGHKVEFDNKDWLESSFLFYDETRKVVKVKIKDVLNIEKLGYTYTSEVNAWRDIRKRYKKERLGRKRSAKEQVQLLPVSNFGTEPRPLDEPIRVLVPRPKTSRNKQEKEDDLEVLIIDDIEYEHGHHINFEVYISKPIEGLAGPDYGEHAGHFIRLPHFHTKKEHHSGRRPSLSWGSPTCWTILMPRHRTVW
ncbi:hypothetical protein Syun_008350 [Stephania yunnanensis]|uniref:Tyrosinase copper-binding domain-containing protein n=1 Tax=Stephania yunnanensis TaxID=152371 RepID=A0AAP0PRA1_9MAGN